MSDFVGNIYLGRMAEAVAKHLTSPSEVPVPLANLRILAGRYIVRGQTIDAMKKMRRDDEAARDVLNAEVARLRQRLEEIDAAMHLLATSDEEPESEDEGQLAIALFGDGKFRVTGYDSNQTEYPASDSALGALMAFYEARRAAR